ncbi:hypothetical protein VTI74DRAFT_11572 [Chaetomium olivicolor]
MPGAHCWSRRTGSRWGRTPASSYVGDDGYLVRAARPRGARVVMGPEPGRNRWKTLVSMCASVLCFPGAPHLSPLSGTTGWSSRAEWPQPSACRGLSDYFVSRFLGEGTPGHQRARKLPASYNRCSAQEGPLACTQCYPAYAERGSPLGLER